MERAIRILDTTLRDGEQTPGAFLSADHKVEVAGRLEAAGVTTIEAGFPVSSPGDFEAVRRVACEVNRSEVAALARCVPGDVDAAMEALRPARQPVVHVFMGTSDLHLECKLRTTRAEAVRRITEAVSRAREAGATVQFSAEDATRSDRTFLRQCVEMAVQSGATRINVPDTVGCALPGEYAELVRDIVRFVGAGVIVSAHCHDDLGLATANTLAAIEAGARQVEVTVNGIGERAGNTSLEQVATACTLKGVGRCDIDLRQLTALSARVAEATGIAVQPNRPVIGANAFAHSSGIHQDGILKEPRTYEFVPPALVGAPGHRFVLTARSGRSAIAHRAAALGCVLTPETLEATYRRVMAEAEAKCGPVTDEDLVRIMGEGSGPVAPFVRPDAVATPQERTVLFAL